MTTRSGPRRTVNQFRLTGRTFRTLRKAALTFTHVLEVAEGRRHDRRLPLVGILSDRELRTLYQAAKVIGRHSAPGQWQAVTR